VLVEMLRHAECERSVRSAISRTTDWPPACLSSADAWGRTCTAASGRDTAVAVEILDLGGGVPLISVVKRAARHV
jgi:hypothetical protein